MYNLNWISVISVIGSNIIMEQVFVCPTHNCFEFACVCKQAYDRRQITVRVGQKILYFADHDENLV